MNKPFMEDTMINELEERSKKRKARRRRRRLVSFLGFILVLIYIPALWNWVFSVNYEIGVIKTATLEIKLPIQGLMIRKETLIESPGDGILIPAIQYGERVAKGNEIASYIKSDMKDVVDNYRQMEIEILKRVVAEFDNAAGSQRELWENAVETQIKKLTELTNSGDMTEAENIRNSIDRVLESRARYMLEKGGLGDGFKIEKKELERLRSNIEGSVQSVVSPQPGVVAYKCDGYEESCTPENRYGITMEQINKALEEKEPPVNRVTPAEINAVKGKPFCRLVENDESWITFSVPEKEAEEIIIMYEKANLENRVISYEIELEGIDGRIPVYLEKVGEPEKGYVLVTARMTRFIEQTINLRGVAGSLITQSVTGMKVPLRSLFNENTVDNTADIAILEMDKVKFIRVQIIGRQESYAIIENLDSTNDKDCVNIFDIYLVNPKNVEEGQVIDK